MSSLENLILNFGYIAILFLMITNGIVSLPSSQFIYVTAGILVPLGHFEFLWIVLVGTVGNTIGNIILYEIARSKGILYLQKFKVFKKQTIFKMICTFKKRGVVIIIIGKFLPGIKVIIPIVAAIGKMRRSVYIIIIAITSLFWAVALTYCGVYFSTAVNIGELSWQSVILFFLTFVALYIFYKYTKSLSVDKDKGK